MLPKGKSPALGTNFSAPLVAALVGYAGLQIASRFSASGRGQWIHRVVADLYLLALFVAVIYVHFHIKMWVPLINPRLYDASYFAIDDRFRFLIEGLRTLRGEIAIVLPAPDVWYELAFFSMFSLSFWFHAAGQRRWHYHNMVAITLTELLGPMLYLVAPAVGPFLFERGDNPMATAAQLRMYGEFQAMRAAGVSWLDQHGAQYFTAPLAAMPSLHFAATFVLAYYAVRARLVVAPIVVAALAWIGIESVASRWHYLVDLPVGLAVAVVAIAIANRLCRHRLDVEDAASGRAAAARPIAVPVWVLAGHRAGDNAQLVALAEALGRRYEVKRLRYRRLELLTNLLFDATLLGRIGAQSSPLGPPWPSLVLSAGRRSEPIARWIRKRAERAPKLVHLGRPWRPIEDFDLVIATPQYPLEPRAGVLRNPLPLHSVTPERLAAAASAWRTRLAHLPRPRTALLVGGNSELFTLGARAAAQLAREASAMARASGGSLLVTTSARTSRRAAAALRAAIDAPAEIFRWGDGAVDNPYWGYLALADAFIVTGDSVSMLTEACATGKPVHIFDPGRARAESSGDVLAAVRRRVSNLGLPRLARDIRRIHDELVGLGRAALLGDAFPGAALPPPDYVEQTVARVRALLSDVPRPASRPWMVKSPRVWAVTCGRPGDDSQIMALAEALAWPFEVKRIAYRRFGRLIDVWRGTTRLGTIESGSSSLSPPWPDLVISASMRNEPVCRWIRKQSGGRARYVHIGKPWARPAAFDLVISALEYHGLPRLPNVVHNAFSLHRVSPARLRDEARRWAPSLAELPRPFVAVLVGGYAGPFALDREKAERLGRQASAMVRKEGGSLLVTTSARTSRAAIEGLQAAIDVPHSLFRWSPGAKENPYFGFLALADAILVTCESTAMLAEACAARKPVYMFDLAQDGAAGEDPLLARPDRGWLVRWWRRCNADRLRAFLYRHVMLRFAPRNIRRDIGAVHELLRSSGRAVWLGESFPIWVPPAVDEMPECVERVRALFEERVIRVPRAGDPADAQPDGALGNPPHLSLSGRGDAVRSATPPGA